MIENGKKVKIHYTLKVGGEVVDSSLGREPLEYEQGAQTIIPGLQKGMEGLKTGDKKQIEVSPEEAYGPVSAQAIVEVPKSDMGSEDIKAGTPIQAKSDQGQIYQGVVKEIRSDSVVVDFNHPLAGKNLVFDVEVLSVL